MNIPEDLPMWDPTEQRFLGTGRIMLYFVGQEKGWDMVGVLGTEFLVRDFVGALGRDPSGGRHDDILRLVNAPEPRPPFVVQEFLFVVDGAPMYRLPKQMLANYAVFQRENADPDGPYFIVVFVPTARQGEGLAAETAPKFVINFLSDRAVERIHGSAAVKTQRRIVNPDGSVLLETRRPGE